MANKKWIEKRKWFLPYMIQGFIVMCVWWRAVGTWPFSLMKIPAYLQLLGRWGLYLRLEGILGAYLPHDEF